MIMAWGADPYRFLRQHGGDFSSIRKGVVDHFKEFIDLARGIGAGT